MKKVLFITALVIFHSFASYAQDVVAINSEKRTIESNVNIPQNIESVATQENFAKETSASSSTEEQNKKKPKKGKGKGKTWTYILSGTFIALVIVIYVATGGQGYNSRTGVGA